MCRWSTIYCCLLAVVSLCLKVFRCVRKKAEVVLVGVVGMQINREDMYKKELDFLISTSYGPGRYDKSYEEQGLDYPLATSDGLKIET